MKKVIEMCPNCEEEVTIDAIKYIPQVCPNCKGIIRACSLCDMDNCNCELCDTQDIELTRYISK